MSFEKFGQFIGEKVGKKVIEILRKKIENFSIEAEGTDNLEKVKNESYLLVANHLKPKEKVSQESAVAPDAFVISKLVAEKTGQKLRIIQKSDSGWWANDPIQKYFQRKFQPFGEKFVEGMGNIPIRKNPNSINREFLKALEKVIEDKDPILIFPEGTWRDGFPEKLDIQPGAAHIAKKYNLKILPVCIEGAVSWKKDQQVSVVFGEPFDVKGLEKDEISHKIEEDLMSLHRRNE